MKLCVLITGLGVGGAESHLLKVLPSLKIPNFVISLTNDDETGIKLKKKGIKIYYLGLRRDCLNILSVVVKFRKIIKKERPEIINSYLIHSNLFGRIFGRMFGIKKIVCSVRNKHINRRVLNIIDRATSGLVDLYLPNSRSVANFIAKQIQIPRKKITVLPNGVDLSVLKKGKGRKSVMKELSLKENSFVIGCVASLEKKKDHATILRAVSILIKKTHKDIVLLLVGDGSQKKNLINLSHKLRIRNSVKFLGRRYDISNLLNAMDVFVLPSLHEGMSNALLEAMSAKKAIVVSAIPENKEVVGESAMTFNPGNANDLATKLERMLIGKKLRAKLGDEAYKRVRQKFDIRKIIEEYEKIIVRV